MLNTFFIAIGLAMDAFAVSISSGVSLKKTNLKTYLYFGLYFGFFQFIMPIIGYYCSGLFSSYFQTYTSYISFGLLMFVGGKMLYEALHNDDENEDKDENENKEENENIADGKILKASNMIMLSVATSIDALVVGILFQINGEPILIGSIIIGVVAAVFSAFGVYIGKKVGNLFGNKAEILGGVILIALAFKALLM